VTTTRTYANATSTATATTALPNGAAVGDLAIMVASGPSASAFVGPSGPNGAWAEMTPVGGIDVGGALSRMAVYSKVLDQADLDQTTVTVARPTSSAPWAIATAAFPGFTAVNAVSASASYSAATVLPYPAVTPAVDNSLIVALGTGRCTTPTQSPNHTQPTSWTYGVQAINVPGPAVLRSAWIDYVQLALGAGVPFSASASLSPVGNGGLLTLALTPAAAPSPTLLYPSNEMVAVAWLKAAVPYLGSRVATELPTDNSTWAASGFTKVAAVGGSPDIYLPEAHPVISVDTYGVTTRSGRPPWNLAGQQAERIRRAILDHALVPQKLTMPTGTGPRSCARPSPGPSRAGCRMTWPATRTTNRTSNSGGRWDHDNAIRHQNRYGRRLHVRWRRPRPPLPGRTRVPVSGP
jgi:hypothetical protein